MLRPNPTGGNLSSIQMRESDNITNYIDVFLAEKFIESDWNSKKWFDFFIYTPPSPSNPRLTVMITELNTPMM